MRYDRIVTFGCSIPFGHGLVDCIQEDMNSPGKFPSNFSYPALLAQKLNIVNLNLSRTGSSIKEACYNIYNFKFSKNDLVLASWSFTERTCIIEDDTDPHIIGTWCPDNRSKLYYKNFYTKSEEQYNTEMNVQWANLYLNSLGVDLINIPVQTDFFDVFKFRNLKIYATETINSGDFFVDHALDIKHPGEQSHIGYSDYLYNKVISI